MHDVIVVGGGIAGLSAALILGRARRRVLVMDAGSPRNAPAAHAHGFITRDNTPPLEMLRIAREELDAYPNIEVLQAEAEDAAVEAGGFQVRLKDGRAFTARKLVLAAGVADVLPEIPGLTELWGDGVHHCPYCHGWEVRETRWAVLGDAPFAFERVSLFRTWASEIVLLANGPSSLSGEERRRLEALGATLEERAITGVARGADGGVSVSFTEGEPLAASAVFAMPHQVHRSRLAGSLGCETFESGVTGVHFVKTDAVSGETSVPGVYAAGDITGPAQSLILAAASGARAAYMLNHVLADEEAKSTLAAATPA